MATEPKMQTIRWWSDAGIHGSERSGDLEIEADATPEEIEQAVRDEVFNHFEWGWSSVEDAE